MVSVRAFLTVAALALLLAPAVPRIAASSPCGCPFDPPSLGNSSAPAVVCVTGRGADGTIDPAYTVVVTVRDVGFNPVVHGDVRVDFSDCTGLAICGVEGSAAATRDPAGHWVQDFTDGSGTVRLRIAGSFTLPPGTPEPSSWRAHITTCGFEVTTPAVAVLDLTGMDGLNGADVAALATDISVHTYFARSDYDANLANNGADLSVLATRLGAKTSMASCPH